MKKTIFIALAIATATSALAQKANIQSASNYLRDKDYEKALEYIDKALADPSTKDDPKAWFVKGNIYVAMQQDLELYNKQRNDKVLAPLKKFYDQGDTNFYQKISENFIKVAQLKATYERESVDNNLIFAAYKYYNNGANAYNAKKYDEANAYLKAMIDIHDLEGGKRFNRKDFDTLAVEAKRIMAMSYYSAGKHDEALPLFQQLQNDPIGKNETIYLFMSDIYKKQNKTNEMLAIIQEGRKQYPTSENLRNEELNYYILTNKEDELVKKLEAAVVADPNNAQLLANMGNTYMNMSFPKDAAGKMTTRPANAEEYNTKAQDAYSRALKIKPDDVDINYNMGVLNYNDAAAMNTIMNGLSTSAEDTKKYEELKLKRDAKFVEAIPYFERIVTLMEPKTNRTADERGVYIAALTALREIYARQSNTDKSAEVNAKLTKVTTGK